MHKQPRIATTWHRSDMRHAIDALSSRYGLSDARGLSRGFNEGQDQRLHLPVIIRVWRDLPEARRTANLLALRRIRRIKHPNIVRLLNYAILPDETVVQVLERVSGPSVAELVNPGKGVDRHEAKRIVMGAARGLGALHQAGVVHGDVSPSNLLFDHSIVKLGDYELAVVVDAPVQCEEGFFSGTPAYTAPELASGSGLPTPQSDLYSLGCVYYELLTGRPPHVAGSALEALYLHATAEIPDPRQFRPDVSDEEVAVLRRLLARSPVDRFQSAAEVVGVLGKL